LEGTVNPSNATNQTIVWSVVSGNADIVNKSNGAYLKPHAAGFVKVRCHDCQRNNAVIFWALAGWTGLT